MVREHPGEPATAADRDGCLDRAPKNGCVPGSVEGFEGEGEIQVVEVADKLGGRQVHLAEEQPFSCDLTEAGEDR